MLARPRMCLLRYCMIPCALLLVTGTRGCSRAHAAGDNPPAVSTPTLLVGEVSSQTGAFQHRLPIELPPARRGLTPSLALSYDSSTGNGLAGVGWSLQGVPAIVRVPGDRGQAFAGMARMPSRRTAGRWVAIERRLPHREGQPQIPCPERGRQAHA
jgi:hypothetical protein